jgi:hypothetical protein
MRNEYEKPTLVDFVDYAVVTDAYTPLSRAADKPSSSWWSGIFGQ